MPTYEFRCPDGHEFEKFYRTISTAEAEAICPQCGKAAERMMSPTGFAFKGSGFYLTDYGKNAHRKEGAEQKAGVEAPANSAKGEGSSSEAKSDAKSDAAKTATKSPETSSSSGEAKKVEPKAEAKPATPPPKPSAGE